MAPDQLPTLSVPEEIVQRIKTHGLVAAQKWRVSEGLLWGVYSNNTLFITNELFLGSYDVSGGLLGRISAMISLFQNLPRWNRSFYLASHDYRILRRTCQTPAEAYYQTSPVRMEKPTLPHVSGPDVTIADLLYDASKEEFAAFNSEGVRINFLSRQT